MNNRLQNRRDWLVELIGEGIRRGIRLQLKEQVPSGFVIDSIRVRLFLNGQWREIVFDGDGRLNTLRDSHK